jgi:heme exporter protein C
MSNRILQNTGGEARRLTHGQLALLLATLALLGLATALSPREATLGDTARLVYLHGAWVWAAKLLFAGAGVVGLVGLALRRPAWHAWSRSLGWTGMLFWMVYLPLSLYIQQITWGGILWDEPRWRVALMFGIVGLLLQIGAYLIGSPALTSVANLALGVGLWLVLAETPNVLHPADPIGQSTSSSIPIFFGILTLLSLGVGAQIAVWLRGKHALPGSPLHGHQDPL